MDTAATGEKASGSRLAVSCLSSYRRQIDDGGALADTALLVQNSDNSSHGGEDPLCASVAIATYSGNRPPKITSERQQPTLRHAEFCVTSGPVFRGKLARAKMEGQEVSRVSPGVEDSSAAL